MDINLTALITLGNNHLELKLKLKFPVLMVMILNVAKATVLADCRLLEVEAYKLNWVPKCGIVVCKPKGYAPNKPMYKRNKTHVYIKRNKTSENDDGKTNLLHKRQSCLQP